MELTIFENYCQSSVLFRMCSGSGMFYTFLTNRIKKKQFQRWVEDEQKVDSFKTLAENPFRTFFFKYRCLLAEWKAVGEIRSYFFDVWFRWTSINQSIVFIESHVYGFCFKVISLMNAIFNYWLSKHLCSLLMETVVCAAILISMEFVIVNLRNKCSLALSTKMFSSLTVTWFVLRTNIKSCIERKSREYEDFTSNFIFFASVFASVPSSLWLMDHIV